IDGTLAEQGLRSPFNETRVMEDQPRMHVVETVKLLARQVIHVFIFSGRTDGCRQETMNWLNEKCDFSGLYNWSLHMRVTGDRRKDAIIKTELFNQWIAGKFNVMAVFDDRAQVIRECWKPLNVPVFRCGVIDED